MTASHRFALIALCALIGCNGSNTSTPTTAPCAPTSAPAAPATAENDNADARRAAAQEYLRVVPVSDLINDMSDKMSTQMPAAQADIFRKMMRETIDTAVLEKAMVDSMTKHFSLREIQALTTFYGAPEGKSVMKKMGDYMADVMPVIQQEIYRAATKTKPAEPEAEKK